MYVCKKLHHDGVGTAPATCTPHHCHGHRRSLIFTVLPTDLCVSTVYCSVSVSPQLSVNRNYQRKPNPRTLSRSAQTRPTPKHTTIRAKTAKVYKDKTYISDKASRPTSRHLVSLYSSKATIIWLLFGKSCKLYHAPRVSARHAVLTAVRVFSVYFGLTSRPIFAVRDCVTLESFLRFTPLPSHA